MLERDQQMEDDEIKIRQYTPKELAGLYQCSNKTLNNWISHLKEVLGPRKGHFYSPRQVRIIVEQIGLPKR